jgi:uncharacterized protein YndB with AHSA1/START domain
MDPTRDELHEQAIAAPIGDVWAFMVDPAALSVWFGADAWLDPIPGGAVSFRFLDGSVRRGTIDVVEPSRRLSWTWREHRGTGFGSTIGEDSSVEIELISAGAGTLVRIVERPPPVDARSRARGAAS